MSTWASAAAGNAEPETPMGPDQQIRSMRFRLGGIRCMVIDDGPVEFAVRELYPQVPDSTFGWHMEHIDPMSGDMFDDTEHRLSYENSLPVNRAGGVPGTVDTPNKSLVIKTEEHIIVVDCGAGLRLSDNRAGKLAGKLAGEGIFPQDVTHVILTHAHYDRVGGAILSDNTPTFPNARYIVSKPEYQYWTTPAGINQEERDAPWVAPAQLRILEHATASQRLKQLEAMDMLDLVQFNCGPDGPPPSPVYRAPAQGGGRTPAGPEPAGGKKLPPKKGAVAESPAGRSPSGADAPPPRAHTKHWGEGTEAEIVPGVSVVFTAGHTEGHMVVRVSDGDETCYVLGDLVIHPTQLAQPKWVPGFHHNPPLAMAKMNELLDRAAQEGAMVQAAHFNYPGVGSVQRRTISNAPAWMVVPHSPGILSPDELKKLIMEHHELLEPALSFIAQLSDQIAVLHRTTHRKPQVTKDMNMPLIQKIDKHFASACKLVEESRAALREGIDTNSVYDPEKFDTQLAYEKMVKLLHEYVWMVMDSTYITESELVDLEFPKHSRKDFTELLYALDGIGELCVQFISALKRSKLPSPYTMFGDHRMVMEVLDVELSEIVFWRQGALRYMYVATLVNNNRVDELEASELETGADRLSRMRSLRHVKEPLSSDNYVMGSGGAEAFKLMEDGIYSDVHLLSMMYEAELFYWRWTEFEKRESLDTSKSVYREKASHLCANFIRIVTHSLADRGWNCDRAQEILREAEQDDSLNSETKKLTL